MWSPMGPHVQWDLSDVVAYGTSFHRLYQTGCCTSEINMYFVKLTDVYIRTYLRTLSV